MNLRVNVQGLDDLIADAQRIGGDLPDRVDDAVVAGAGDVANAVRANAPRVTGNLAGSTRVEAQGAGRAAVIVDARAPEDGYMYAGRIEARQGFTARAVAQTRDQVIERIDREVRAVVESA